MGELNFLTVGLIYLLPSLPKLWITDIRNNCQELQHTCINAVNHALYFIHVLPYVLATMEIKYICRKLFRVLDSVADVFQAVSWLGLSDVHNGTQRGTLT